MNTQAQAPQAYSLGEAQHKELIEAITNNREALANFVCDHLTPLLEDKYTLYLMHRVNAICDLYEKRLALLQAKETKESEEPQ